jgi:ATP-binding cassette, subfamily B, bacterial
MFSRFREAVRIAFRVAPGCAVVTTVLGILSGLAAAPAAWLTKRLLDDLTSHSNHASVVEVGVLAASAVLLVGTATCAAYAAGIAGTRLAARVQIETETQLAGVCASFVGTSFLDDPAQQDRLLLAQRGAHDAPTLVTSSTVACFSSIATISGFVVVLYASWPVMLLATAAVAVPVSFIQRNVSRRAVAVAESAATSYRWRDYYAQVFTNPVSARDIRIHGAEQLFVNRLSTHLSAALTQETRQQARAAWLQMAFTVLNAAIAATGAVVVALAVAHGQITVGDFVLFLAAVAAVQASLSALLRLGGQMSVSLGVFAHYLAFTAPVETPPTALSADRAAPALQSGVELRDVWFRYREDTEWVLRGVSLRLGAGQNHALVGINGAGKSTLVKLLFRFHDPTKGQILWDGIDIAQIDPHALRRRMAGVLQDYFAYELTALENITLGDLDHLGDTTHARRAAQRANVLDVIDSLPVGMNTMLSSRRADNTGRDGVSLSGGQWQRVALARAMMRPHADLLILDEPNSGLDAAAEHELHATLMSLGVGRTRLLISHRLGALRHADQIIVLDQGAVCESGTHQQLMSNAGPYARLFNLQASPYLDLATAP